MSSHWLCGYRKGFITKAGLLYFIGKWNFMLDKTEHVGAILMDLSKAFDTSNNKLLAEKLNAYGFSKETPKLIFSSLKNRTQRVKINKTFS